MRRRILHDLLPISNPRDPFDEVMATLRSSGHNGAGDTLAKTYDLAADLYRGAWPHYQASDTGYHDFLHVAETFLAMARLIHGALLGGVKFAPREIAVGLTAAMLHDVGYLRNDEEQECRGAYFRSTHEQRSMAFLGRHGRQLGLSAREIDDGRDMIQSTIMAEDVAAITFRSETATLLGRMLACADLLAQLSSSLYLEKLIDLFQEDQDADRPHYADLQDCMRRAITFDAAAGQRVQQSLPAGPSFLKAHFKARWGDTRDLYAVAITRQKERLAELLRRDNFEPRRHLQRWGSLATLRRVFQ
jgi:hypothetical protein